MNAYIFRPKLWAVVVIFLLAAGMVRAGCWQYGKGVQKQALQVARAEETAAAPQALLADVTPPAPGRVRRVFVEGQYAPELGLQLDNQPHQKQAGVHAWTPLVLASGERVIVDRGWLPLDAEVLPPPIGPQRIEGHWKRLPTPGMRLGSAMQGCPTPRPERVNYPEMAELRCLFGDTTLDGVLELDTQAPGGFVRDWAASGTNEIPPSRHFAYAAQWWLFATTLVALFIKINLRRQKVAHD